MEDQTATTNQEDTPMPPYILTITRVPGDPQGDLVHRTRRIEARSPAEAGARHTVGRLVGTMDGVVDWHASAYQHG